MPNPGSLLKGEPQVEVTRGGTKPLGTTGSCLQQQLLVGTVVAPLPGRLCCEPGSKVG